VTVTVTVMVVMMMVTIMMMMMTTTTTTTTMLLSRAGADDDDFPKPVDPVELQTREPVQYSHTTTKTKDLAKTAYARPKAVFK